MVALIWTLTVVVVASLISGRQHWRQFVATLPISLIGAFSGAAAGGLALANLIGSVSGLTWETIGIGLGAPAGAAALLVAERRLSRVEAPVSASEER